MKQLIDKVLASGPRRCSDCSGKLDRTPASAWEALKHKQLCWSCFCAKRCTSSELASQYACPHCGRGDKAPATGPLGHAPWCPNHPKGNR